MREACKSRIKMALYLRRQFLLSKPSNTVSPLQRPLARHPSGLTLLLSTVVVIVMVAVYGAPAIGAIACIPVSLGYHSAGIRVEGTAILPAHPSSALIAAQPHVFTSKGRAPCPSASSEAIKKGAMNIVFIVMCRLPLP